MSSSALATVPSRQKELGAYYTPAPMARLLTEWAIRRPADRALDPSFGGLVFWEAASRTLADRGRESSLVASQIYGIDLDEDALRAADADSDLDIAASNLIEADFFDVSPADLPGFEAVIGNPPYVRYQGWNSEAARELCDRAGVKLTRLASTWAPFLVHAASFVAPGGRMAMVLPGEMLHAQYATQVVDFLARSFGRLQMVVFDHRVFPGALEEVVLLFADGRGAGQAQGVELIEASDLSSFDRRTLDREPAVDAHASVAQTASGGRTKLLGQLLSPSTRDLYDRTLDRDDVATLGEIASVDIGCVTGANDFFLLAAEDADAVGEALTSLCVSRAGHVQGARLAERDIEALRAKGARLDLFTPGRGALGDLPLAARELIARGEAADLHERYKCRVRTPWWRCRSRARAPLTCS